MTHPAGRDSGPNTHYSPSNDPAAELALLRTVLEGIGETIIITDAGHDPPGPRIEYVNPAFTLMTGYSAAEVLGQTPRMLQGPSTDREVLDEIRAALVAGRPFRGETINYRKDGTEYLVEWLMTPVTTGGGISRWIAAQRDVTAVRRTELHRLQLAAEVNHRVNNTLAAVQSVAAQTARRAGTAVEFKAAFQLRLHALSQVHRLLARNHWAGASLAELAAAQVAPHVGGDGLRLLSTGPEFVLRPGAAVALGMALAELAANAAEHGALSVAGGHVRLQWHIEPGTPLDRLCLRWTERGGPPVQDMPTRRGFGFRFVEHGLAHELRAETRLAFERAGLQCEIVLPANTVRS